MKKLLASLVILGSLTIGGSVSATYCKKCGTTTTTTTTVPETTTTTIPETTTTTVITTSTTSTTVPTTSTTTIPTNNDNREVVSEVEIGEALVVERPLTFTG